MSESASHSDGRQRTFTAFISYATKDAATAQWLHGALERYRVPRALVGTHSDDGPIPRSLKPIFRDREELRTGTVLNDELVKMLGRSRHLIVVCSPDAACSNWVDLEIRQFRAHRAEGMIHPLIARGEPESGDPTSECLPPALRSINSTVIGADLRQGGDGRDGALLKIASGLLGVDLGVLKNRDNEARRRRLYVWLVVSVAAAAVFAGIAFYANEQRLEAVAQAKEAASQRDRSLTAQSRLLADVANQRTARHDEGTAVTVALEALPSEKRRRYRPYLPEAEAALYSALVDQREIMALRHRGAVSHIEISRDSRLLVASFACGVCLWDLNERRVRLALDPKGNPLPLSDAHVCPARTPDEQCPSRPSVDGLAGATISRSGEYLAMATEDERIVVRDSETGSVVRDLSPGGIAAQLTFSPSGSQLASLIKRIDPESSSHIGPVSVRIDNIETGASRTYDGSACGREDEPQVVSWIGHKGRIAASGEESTCLWDPSDSRIDRGRVIRMGRLLYSTIQFSNDGERALWMEDPEDSEVRVRLIKKNVDVARSPTPAPHQGRIVDAALSGDGKWVLEGFADGSARVWDVATRSVKLLHGGARGRLVSVAFSPDGTLAAVLTADVEATAELEDAAVSVWTVATGALRTIVAGPRERWLTSFSFSTDGRHLATSAETGAVRLYSVEEHLPFYRVFSDHDAIDGLRLSPDGTQLVTTEWGKRGARLFRVQDGVEIPLPTEVRGALDAVVSPDWRTIALKMRGGAVLLLDVSSLHTTPLPHPENVQDVRFDRSGSRLLTSCNDGKARLWNTKDGSLLETYSGHRGLVWEATFSPSEDRVLTLTSLGESRLYATDASSPGTSLATQGLSVVRWSLPDGRLIATGSSESSDACLWQDGVQVRCLPGHLGGVRSIAWNRDGRLAIGGQEGSIWMWESPDAATGRLLFDNPRDDPVMKVEWSPDGRWLTSVTGDTVRVLDSTRGKVIIKTFGHDTTSVAFSPDGQRVAFVSGNDTIEVVNLALGKGIARIRATTDTIPPDDGQDAPAPSLAFSADGNWLASTHVVKTARVSRIWKNTEALVDEACRRQPVVLSSEERLEFVGDGDPSIDPCDVSDDRR